MDSGWAAVAGSAVGVFGTLAATWLNVHLSRAKPDPAETAAKDLLKAMLSRPNWNWASVAVLANVVGTDEVAVRRLLLEIGARGSMINGRVWGLNSLNPIESTKLPADDPDDPDDPSPESR